MIKRMKSILENFLFRGLMIILLSSPIFMSCIQELGVFTRVTPAFIIDGVITNEFGPHAIKISKTKEYNTAATYFPEVENATVIIEDSEGSTIQLSDQYTGIYYTPDNFIGIIGNSYRLTVTLNSGEVYQSEFEELLPVPSIDNIFFDLVNKEVLSEANIVSNERVVSFFIDYTDPANDDNYYRWRYHETFEIFAPEAETMRDDLSPQRRGRCGKLSENPTCWAKGYDHEFLKIDRDLSFDGKEMKDIEIFYAEIGRKFAVNYMVEIQQHSLTPNAYKYWQAIENQIGNNGTIFETSNYQIRGNIYNPKDEKELVLGYFGASAVASESILVRSSDIGYNHEYACEPNEIGCIPALCIDCTKYSFSSSIIKPDFWPL